MRKAYNLKRLTGQVKRFAAFMLITLMAVGNVFADQVTYVFSEQGYANAEDLVAADFNNFISFTPAKNEGSNAPKYYTTGNAGRIYGRNTFTLTPAAGYVITGVTMNAVANNNSFAALSYTVDGSETSVPLTAVDATTGKDYIISGINATQSVVILNPATSGHARIVSITVDYEVYVPSAVATPTVTPVAGTYYTSQLVQIFCETAGANIYYAINGGEPVLYSHPFSINTTTTLTAYAVLGDETSATLTVNYVFPIQIANIADFYNGQENTLYQITGDVQYVWRNGQNMYVQDATGGLLVYDESNKVTSTYNNGDVISGIVGTFKNYNGLYEMIPTANYAEGTSGAAILPVEATVAQILANPDDYMSKLVILRNGAFTSAQNFTNNSAKNVNFTQDGSTIQVRSQFKNISMNIANGDRATVIGFVGKYNSTIQLFPRGNGDILRAALPYACNFDGNEHYVWTLVNGDNINKWYIGQAQSFDNNKLYISSSNGLTNKYNVTAASDVHAYFDVTLPNSDVLLSFDCRAMGEDNDYLQISVLADDPVAGTLPTDYIVRINNKNEFTHQTVLIPASYAGNKKIVFTWHNDNANGTQAPAAIDNITMEATCTMISDLAAVVNGQTATVTWTAPAGQNAWVLQYKSANSDAWQTVNATNTTVTLENLDTQKDYVVRVKANCADNASAWVSTPFNVPCINGTLAPADVTIGDGTSTTYNAPMNSFYKNSWTQMIYPASAFTEAGYISALSWYVNAANAHNYQTLKIYLGTTTASINESTSSWLSMDDLTLVYESNNGTMGETAGWETYELATPFYYTPGENLVVVTARTADNYKSLYYRNTSVTNSVLYRRSDSSPESYGSHPGTATGSRVATLPNMLVTYMDDCHDAHCAAPAGLTVNNITTTGANLTWEAGDATAWILAYKAEEDADYTVVNLTDNHYDLSNLTQNTNYQVRVKADCGTVGMSEEAAANFTTVADCQTPTGLAVHHEVANTIVTWVGYPNVNAYEVQYADAGSNIWNTTVVNNVTTFILNGLVEGNSYKVRVRSICGETSTSDWTPVVTYTRPVYCDIPTQIAATEINATNATLTWAAGQGTSWIVNYGVTDSEDFTAVTTNTNTITLTGLDPQTDYTVYVKANCGEYPSVWSAGYNFTTDCAPITVTESSPWFEDFEGYTGSGEKPFVCWATPVKTNGGGPFVYCGYSSSCHSGANSAELKGYDNVLVLPAFTNDIHTLKLSFWATAVTPSDGTLELGILTDVNDMNSFQFVANVTGPSSRNGVGNYMGPFSFENVTATNGRIALRYHSNNGTSNSWNLDDFTVYLEQDCYVPTNILAENIDLESASINWNINNEETEWQLEYGPAGFVLGQGTTVTVNSLPPYVLENLTEDTQYDVYVKAICDATHSSVWSDALTFTTASSSLVMCDYTISLEDSWGDGWNGNTLVVTANGTEVGTYTISSGSSATYTISVPNGAQVTFEYVGGGSYQDENSLEVTDANGESIWSMSSGSAAGAVYSATLSCVEEPVTCDYSVVLEDSWGDGWNGNTLVVTVDGTVLDTYTVSSGSSASYTLTLADGANVVFQYVGGGSYQDENSIKVWAPDNSLVWNMIEGSSAGETYNMTADCGGGVVPGNTCDFTIHMEDSYGDGWNGNSLKITAEGATVGTYTISYGYSDNVTVSLEDGVQVTFEYIVGGSYNTYPDENSFEILDPNNNVVWSLTSPDASASFSTVVSCGGDCTPATELAVIAFDASSATLAWEGDTALTYEVSYKAGTDAAWTTITVTGTEATLTGLTANTTYFAKVKATCDNTYTDEVSFFATSAGLNCSDRTISAENGSGYYTPVNDYYRNSRSEQIYTPEEVGAAGSITKISFNYQGSATMTKKNNVKIYLAHTTKDAFASTTDWTTTGTTLVYTGNLNCSTGWNEFVLDDEFSYNGNDNLIVIVDDESGDYGSSANKFYYTNCTGYKCLTFQNDSYTWTNHSSKTGTRRTYRPDIRFNVCSSADDIAINDIHEIPNACDLSNIPVTIDIKNAGSTNVSTCEAYYRINDGTAVHETVTMTTPLAQNDIHTYTFNALANMTAASNVITAWVEVPGDGNFNNNMAVSNEINLIDAVDVPFVETFTPGEINDGWNMVDANGDNITFTIANGKASYTFNDTLNADDWLMTTCMYVPSGYWTPSKYMISYSYNANDPTMTENFGVYYGKKVNGEYVMNHWVNTHEFNNTDMVTVQKVITVQQSGIYYFGIHATSLAGNAGFNISDFSVKPVVNYSVYAASNGTTDPDGSAVAAEGDEVTVTITPDAGYHVLAIYKNQVLVRGENQNNATVEYYTFVPEDWDNIYVTFAPNSYNVNATVENLIATLYNNNAPGGTYTPSHEVVAHGGSHTGVFTLAPYFHIESFTVNGMDVTPFLIPMNTGNQYGLTLSNIMEDKNIHVYTALDSTTITYTVLAGQGTINGEFEVGADATYPAVYTVTMAGYSDLLSTITPAPGYHIASLIIDGVEHTNIDVYSFEHLVGNHTVEVIFAKNHYVITTAGYGNGTVSAGVEFDYDPDITYVFTATPNAGYHVGTVTRNNVALPIANPGAMFTDTLTNILDNYNYEVMFVQCSYTISATCGSNGTISPLGASSYHLGQNAVYNINAAPGYYIASITVDGVTTNYTQVDALTATTYTFPAISASHVINATFAQMMFNITVNAGANGAISPAANPYAYGATPTFTITPNSGYIISDVTVDGASVGAVSSYTFQALTADHTIAATFAANVFTITATASNGGTISDAGAQTVAYNANKTYTITPATGYHVSDVYVDGASVGAVTTYTFNNVAANHTIYAVFAVNEYTVTVTDPSNGSITPGTITVQHNATPAFVITPDPGYRVSTIKVNNTNVNLNNVPNVNGVYTYTFSSITSNQTLTATMVAKTYTITATANANGSITPSGVATVNHGASKTYTIAANPGYVIDQVTVDGMSVGATNSYTFTNVVANHSIQASFKLAECEVPTFLYTTHISVTSAMLNWSHPTATSFDIQYKTPTGTYTAVTGVTGNSYELTGLQENTQYLWQVRANCTGNNHSDWSNLVSFKTDPATIDNTGIEDVVKANIQVYAEHQNVHILNNEGMNIDNVRIFDAYGKLIYSGAVNSTHEVIGLNVAAGTYIVNVATDKGVANYKVTIMK